MLVIRELGWRFEVYLFFFRPRQLPTAPTLNNGRTWMALGPAGNPFWMLGRWFLVHTFRGPGKGVASFPCLNIDCYDNFWSGKDGRWYVSK